MEHIINTYIKQKARKMVSSFWHIFSIHIAYMTYANLMMYLPWDSGGLFYMRKWEMQAVILRINMF
jgi:hypothetical protein